MLSQGLLSYHSTLRWALAPAGARAMRRLLLLLFMLLCLSPLAMAAESLLPPPPEGETDVQLWFPVNTEKTSNDGFRQQQHNL